MDRKMDMLSPAEVITLAAMARGGISKTVGAELNIGEQAIKNRLTEIRRKLDAKTTTEAVWKAVSRGIIPPENGRVTGTETGAMEAMK